MHPSFILITESCIYLALRNVRDLYESGLKNSEFKSDLSNKSLSFSFFTYDLLLS
jgi:hypothetical protein